MVQTRSQLKNNNPVANTVRACIGVSSKSKSAISKPNKVKAQEKVQAQEKVKVQEKVQVAMSLQEAEIKFNAAREKLDSIQVLLLSENYYQAYTPEWVAQEAQATKEYKEMQEIMKRLTGKDYF